MALPAATNFGIGFLLLFVLSDRTWGARGGDAPSLCYNFSITSKPSPGRPWCDIQGIINGNTFLHYCCGGKKVELVGSLGMKLNDTESWERQTETLKDLLEELRKKLLDMKAEAFPHSDSLSLQGKMVCLCGDNGRPSGSWEFWINGQISYFFNSENREWTVLHPKGHLLKGTLDNDRDLTNSLTKISNGDCKMWLEQISLHWDEMLATTAAPATNPGETQVKATAVRPIAWILPQLLTCSVLLGIQGTVL